MELLLRNRASVIYPEIFRTPCREDYALNRKMFDTFLMIARSSIVLQRLGEIELRAPAVGAKMWCLYFCLSRSESGGPFAGVGLI